MTKNHFLTSYYIKSKNLFSSNFFPFFLGVISGISVFYFLYFFEAYGIQKGISYSGHSHLFRSISFGVLTFVYLTVFEMWFKPKWTTTHIKNEVIWYFSLLLVGSHLIFLLFNYFWNWQEWNIEAYLLIIKEFPLMMVLPFSFSFSIKAISKPKKIEKDDSVVFQSDNGKDQLIIRLQDFIYASSSDNYISVFYLSNHNVKQHLIRKPLKTLEQDLMDYPEIKRIHRSYLVNKSNIQAIKQLRGKVQVEINGVILPISKQFQKDFLN